KHHGKVIVVANKCEGRAGQTGLAEAHALGFGQPIPVSAEHGEGLSDLHEAMARLIPAVEEDEEGDEEPSEDLSDKPAEAAAAADTLDAIRLADVVVVVLDAADMAEKQDLTVAGRVIDEGRALVIAVNRPISWPTTAAPPARRGASFQTGWKRRSPRSRTCQ